MVKYIKVFCPVCKSSNQTPINKRVENHKSVCEFICEDCGHKSPTTVYVEGE